MRVIRCISLLFLSFVLFKSKFSPLRLCFPLRASSAETRTPSCTGCRWCDRWKGGLKKKGEKEREDGKREKRENISAHSNRGRLIRCIRHSLLPPLLPLTLS